MADKAYFLSEADKAVLKEMIDERLRRLANVPRRRDHEGGDGAPDLYIVKTPVNGIEGFSFGAASGTGVADLVDDVISWADCQVYEIVERGANVYHLAAVDGLVIQVFNMSASKINGYEFATAWRDRFGKWVTFGYVSGVACTDGSLVVTKQ